MQTCSQLCCDCYKCVVIWNPFWCGCETTLLTVKTRWNEDLGNGQSGWEICCRLGCFKISFGSGWEEDHSDFFFWWDGCKLRLLSVESNLDIRRIRGSKGRCREILPIESDRFFWYKILQTIFQKKVIFIDLNILIALLKALFVKLKHNFKSIDWWNSDIAQQERALVGEITIILDQ